MRDQVVTTARGAPRILAGAIALACAATIVTVWTLEARGFTPCELCLKERIPFYLAIGPAAVLALFGDRLPRRVPRGLFLVLALLFLGDAVLGGYHAGVEWKLWAGPTECSGAASAPADVNDFLKQLKTTTVVRCDEAALQVLGLSLAAWNALLSAGLCALAVLGWRRTAS